MKNSKWIWCVQNELHEYNQTVRFKKEFDVESPNEALLQITADSWYRVSINGKWLNDGPARAYPNHWQYDEVDISAALKKGNNKIEVIVRYFGTGTFHQIPQAAGLRASILIDGSAIGTNAEWLAAPSNAWKQWTPKISVQMEAVEEYDAQLGNVLDWQSAIEIRRTGKIAPRNTGLLTKKPLRPRKDISKTIVKRAEPQFTVPVTQLAHPGRIEANGYTSRPVILTAAWIVKTKQQFDFGLERRKSDFLNPGAKNWQISVAGRILKTGKVTLSAGRHQVLFACTSFYGHEKDISFPYLNMKGGRWADWKVAVLDEFIFTDNDRNWFCFTHDEAEKVKAGYFKKSEQLAAICTTKDKTEAALAGHLKILPAEQFFMDDFTAEFAARKPVGLTKRIANEKIIAPAAKGDIELCYDFGKQTCGYFEFSIQADAGITIDLNTVEYITPDGVIQHTLPFNRNGMRYITKKGLNRFTSLKRRAGRFLFITLRNQKTPIEIKAVRIIESTAPVKAIGSFQCNDPLLNKVWNISERTLQLCMEDTFTDCPLYEQTLWIGDARNEALYAFTAYGNYDVSARSLELGAQSLEQFPMVGCQVPSSWDCLLPAWSFLWGMHVWEHYFHSGDKRLLKKLWPAVLKNLSGAEHHMDEHGLFSASMWNLLEWAAIDHDNKTVLHNSMLLVGALRAAENCAETLGETAAHKKLITQRKRLARAINAQWDEQKNSYPDALLDTTGEASPKTCQHTSMLAIMCDITTSKIRKPALENLLNPPEGMTSIGSPFAMQFMYEALEKASEFDALLGSIRNKYQPMVDVGSSTVWEMFDGSDFNTYGFPTRSHCHAWASSPVYFLNRIVLGIRQTVPGGKAFEISPWIGHLRHARGGTATPHGLVSVDWKTISGKKLKIVIRAPKAVNVEFKANASHNGLSLEITNTYC